MGSHARARALADYSAQTVGEVSFVKGEVVEVDLQAQAPDGYLQVTVASTNTSGLAPMMGCLLYTSPSPRDLSTSRMPSSA